MSEIKARIFLKNGNIIEFYTKKLISKKHYMAGEITSLEWENIEGREKLFSINLSCIEAITTQEFANEDVEDEKELQNEAKCLQCLYSFMTEDELAKLGSDPCETCNDLCNWKPKELNPGATPKI